MSSTNIEVTEMTGRNMRDEFKRELEDERRREQERQEAAERAADEREEWLKAENARHMDECRMDEARKALYAVPPALLRAASYASDALKVPVTWTHEPGMTLNANQLEADPSTLDDDGLNILVTSLEQLARNATDTALFETSRVAEAESAVAILDSATVALANMRPSLMALMEDRIEAYRARELAAKKYAADASTALEAALAERKGRQPMTAGEIRAALDEQQQAIDKLASRRTTKKQ